MFCGWRIEDVQVYIKYGCVVAREHYLSFTKNLKAPPGTSKINKALTRNQYFQSMIQSNNNPNHKSAIMFSSMFSSSSSVESSSTLSPFPAGCRDYRRSSSPIPMSRTSSTSSINKVENIAVDSSYMPRGARDYERLSVSDVEQSCLVVTSEGVLRKTPLGSIHYKLAVTPMSSRRSSRSTSSDRLL